MTEGKHKATQFLAKNSQLLMLAAICLLMALQSANFRQPGNLQSVLLRTSVVGIIAMGQLLVILTGGIDLSVGSVAALAGMSGCLAMTHFGAPASILSGALVSVLGLICGMAVGVACGIVNGALITRGRIPPFIVTLGMMMIARGFTLILSKGQMVFGLPQVFGWLGGSQVWWVPVVITLVITFFFAGVLHLTRFGRSLYAIGGNLRAATLTGLPVDKARIAAYGLSGLLSGFAGMMLSSRMSIASPNAAEMYELDAIAACVIGGASLMGGEGGALAALAGALIMSVLNNYGTLEDWNPYWQRILVGGLIIALVFYDGYRKRKAGLAA